MLFALLAAVAFGGECDGQVNAQCSSCTYTANCAWMVESSTCLSIGNADVLRAYKEDNSSVKTKHSGCTGARSVESRLERLVTELVEARGVVSHGSQLDFAPSALKGRLARDMCFSDCYAMNGKYDYNNCWQFQPCYDNCVQACLDALLVTYNADVAALDEHLVKIRRGVVSHGSQLDFAPSALKGRLARGMCFSDCYEKNGKYDYNHCWQSQPCRDNCVQACLNADSEVTYNADVAALDEHLVKTRRDVVSYGSQLDFAPSALKGRLARDTCFSDCYEKNGKYDYNHCWQSQPCYDNCVTACIDADPVTFNADVAALDEHLVKYPTEFKCWVRMPTGCDRSLSETSDPLNWFVYPSAGNSATCTSRLAAFNKDCSRSDAESEFRGVKPPAEALANGGAADGAYKGRSVGAGGRF